jgi:hypothetical protein
VPVNASGFHHDQDTKLAAPVVSPWNNPFS